MEKLSEYFYNSGFSNTEIGIICELFVIKSLKKGDLFVIQGKISNELAFINEGMFQYFSLVDGEEKTTYISFENNFIASLLSYLGEIPARESIKALTDATIFTITKDNIVKLQQEIPLFKDFYIGLIEWQICCIDKSKFDLLTLNAEERYLKIINEEPHLLQRVPLQYIASMLGITQRHLSRLRSGI